MTKPPNVWPYWPSLASMEHLGIAFPTPTVMEQHRLMERFPGALQVVRFAEVSITMSAPGVPPHHTRARGGKRINALHTNIAPKSGIQVMRNLNPNAWQA